MRDRKQTVIIAEAGVNHNGSLATALELVDVAASSGADVVKFQFFRPTNLATKDAQLKKYQLDTSASVEHQVELLEKLELSFSALKELEKTCRAKKIEFLSSAFDVSSLKKLNTLNCKRVKVASGELTNKPLLRTAAQSGLPIIVSTGMADLDEIRWALDTIVSEGAPLCQVTLLHCTTNYPSRYDELNLLAIKTIQNEFGVDVGYSDHSMGADASLAAVALGATIIEKHLTLDQNMSGPDHKASMPPNEFKEMVQRIRQLEISLGNGVKRPQQSELENRMLVRKSIIANTPIACGDKFTHSNLTTKRPCKGISAARFDDVIGKVANRDYQPDEFIDKAILE